MNEYLVTGGAGFIGSHLTEKLLAGGNLVRVLDNFSTGKKENLNGLQNIGGKLEIIEGDVADFSLTQQASKGVKAIFHQAALGSVPKSVADPLNSNHANVSGTLAVLEAARQEKVERVILASSSSVYGDSAELPKLETMPLSPLSPYAVTKATLEMYAKVFQLIHKLPVFILRYFNVFGPRQDPDSQYAAVIPLFFSKLVKNQAPTIFGDGQQSRDFTYVEDCVRANLLCLKADEKAFAKAINIAGGKRITINQLYQNISAILNKDIKPIFAEPRAGDIKHSLADISLADKLLGYRPTKEVKDGLQLSATYYLQKNSNH